MTDDEAEAGLYKALADAIETSEFADVLISGYVVIAAFTDRAGQAALFVGTPATQREHETLGLLEAARLTRVRDGAW